MNENDSVELIRVCAQTYWLLRNYSIDSRNDKQVKSAEFDQGMYGPDKYEWSGSPVGFSWDIEFLFENGTEEYITLEVTFESEWIVVAERSEPTPNGPESVENIFEFFTDNTSECVRFLADAAQAVIEYCNIRKKENA